MKVTAVKHLLVVIALFSFATTVCARSATDEAFENLADEYISDLSNFSPVYATLVGDHSADHKLDHVGAAARLETRELLTEYITALNALDRGELSRANLVDAEILLNQLESDLWSLDELQEWAWNPLSYINISGSAIYGLVARDFAPIETRLLSAASRLEQIPRFLEQARASIDPHRVPIWANYLALIWSMPKYS